MKRLIAVTCLFLASIPVCSAQEKLRIVTTTSDLRSLAKAVGAEQVIVSSLLPSGETPEEYQPKLQDVDQLKGAKIVIRAAPGVDPWFDKLLARGAVKHDLTGLARGEPGYLDASTAVANDPLTISAAFPRSRRASRGGPNPHYWLDPKSADAITEKMLAAFSKADPKNAKYYETNRKNFLARLDGKITEWQARLAPFRKEPMIAFHDDWSYFANRFGLNIVDYMAVRDRAPPKRAKMAELVKLMKDKGIKLILAEVNQPERHANKLAQQTGAKVVALAGSVGELPQTDDYISLFEANVNALVAAKK
jgi:ABC-type Zn uptake system ZnuABC Zn-binding protein ZnuA